MTDSTLLDSPLVKKNAYINHYDPSLLFPIARTENRAKMGLNGKLPFHGTDIWTSYELSWLNPQGKPIVATGEFIIPCESSHIIESKSMKLYLNSFNQTKFADHDEVADKIISDVSKAINCKITVKLFALDNEAVFPIKSWSGTCLDNLDIATDTYLINPEFLRTENTHTTESVYSHLLKSNCLVTSQPDWGGVFIKYTGNKINHEGLLKYIISFRNCSEFAEPCAERIFTDILSHCHPEKLTVYLRFTRRGGLDINPFRSNFETTPANERLSRQ